MSVRRRGNGLTAQSYVLLLEIDPRLSERLLTALAGVGVAAYSTPATGRSGPLLDKHLPSRPLETVHVDATRRPDARRVLEQTMPDVTDGLPSVEEEDQFAALVAGWNEEPATADWPPAEDLDEDGRKGSGSRGSDPGAAGQSTEEQNRPGQDRPSGAPRDDETPDPTTHGRRRTDRDPDAAATPSAADGLGTRDGSRGVSFDKPSSSSESDETSGPPTDSDASAEDAPDDDPAEDDDHFVPPPLDALPPSHPVTKWGLVALGVGILLLIFPTLLGLEHSTAVDLVAVLCILGAVGMLVSRLSNRSTDEYDGPDDGAIV